MNKTQFASSSPRDAFANLLEGILASKAQAISNAFLAIAKKVGDPSADFQKLFNAGQVSMLSKASFLKVLRECGTEAKTHELFRLPQGLAKRFKSLAAADTAAREAGKVLHEFRVALVLEAALAGANDAASLQPYLDRLKALDVTGAFDTALKAASKSPAAPKKPKAPADPNAPAPAPRKRAPRKTAAKATQAAPAATAAPVPADPAPQPAGTVPAAVVTSPVAAAPASPAELLAKAAEAAPAVPAAAPAVDDLG